MSGKGWCLSEALFRGLRSVQSVTHVRLCDPMDCSTPGFPVHYHLELLKLVSIELVMPSNHLILCHPLLFLPSIFPSIRWEVSQPMSQLFTPGGQSIGASASVPVLPMTIQGWFPLGLTGFISLLSKGLSRVFSSTTVWKHQFCGAQPSLWCNSHIGTWLVGKPELWLYRPLSAKWCFCFLICCLGLS